MGRMILFRSEVRRKKLELFNKPSKLTKEGVDSMKEEVKRCKEWEVAIQGWRVALEEEVVKAEMAGKSIILVCNNLGSMFIRCSQFL